jgi:phosphoglucomutase
MIYHPETGLDIGDPPGKPLTKSNLPSSQRVRNAFAEMILSASGFRKVFAAQSKGDRYAPWSDEKTPENSLNDRISPEDVVLAAGMAKAFGDYLIDHMNGGFATFPRCILLGIDTRPTGPAIADIIARVLLGMGFDVHYLFIVPAPEIMAYAKYCGSLSKENPEKVEGFVYISASHNPPGHNGIKFGAANGGVLPGPDVASIISGFRAFVSREDSPLNALALIEASGKIDIERCYGSVSAWKRKSRSAYMLFSHEILTSTKDLETQTQALETLAESCESHPLGILAELNGSARCLSIDKDWLESLGVAVKSINDSPGIFAHRIVPEGDSLIQCMSELDAAHAKNAEFSLGYTPDCDGDRGNLVFFDSRLGKSRILQAQEVFALSCLSELGSLVLAGEHESGNTVFAPLKKTAIAVNDATSMRIEEISSRFGAKVFRAETGEANVVMLADKLRAEGWRVRILGEGSNGGNITFPGRVRDPLSTLGAMIKLLRMSSPISGKSLFDVWREVSGLTSYSGKFDLGDIIETLPAWVTTSAFEPRAALRIASVDKVGLKSRYAGIFEKEWRIRAPELHTRYGIVSWKAFATNGLVEREIGADFGASGQGGLRIVFYAAGGKAVAFLWARGSGTEPVFRAVVDVAGGTDGDELYFHTWHVDMIRRADQN